MQVAGVSVKSRHRTLAAARAAAAKFNADHQKKYGYSRPHSVIQGDHPWFWVVDSRYAPRLIARGYERA